MRDPTGPPPLPRLAYALSALPPLHMWGVNHKSHPPLKGRWIACSASDECGPPGPLSPLAEMPTHILRSLGSEDARVRAPIANPLALGDSALLRLRLPYCCSALSAPPPPRGESQGRCAGIAVRPDVSGIGSARVQSHRCLSLLIASARCECMTGTHPHPHTLKTKLTTFSSFR